MTYLFLIFFLLIASLSLGSVYGYKKPLTTTTIITTTSSNDATLTFLGSITGASSSLILSHENETIGNKVTPTKMIVSSSAPEEEEAILINRNMMLARGGFL